MSIKSLFENIADAIKDKNPNIATVTPVEMPSAIRSIPSGSSTAGGVTYDNTASGLTANNVQDAIDELAEDVSTINSDLSEKQNKTWTLVGESTSVSNITLDLTNKSEVCVVLRNSKDTPNRNRTITIPVDALVSGNIGEVYDIAGASSSVSVVIVLRKNHYNLNDWVVGGTSQVSTVTSKVYAR